MEYNSDRMFKFKPEQAQSDILKSREGSHGVSDNKKDFASEMSSDSKNSSLSVNFKFKKLAVFGYQPFSPDFV